MNDLQHHLDVLEKKPGALAGSKPLKLLARNYRVRGLVRDRAKAAEMFGSSVQYAVGDVREVATLPAAMNHATYVICAIGSKNGWKPMGQFRRKCCVRESANGCTLHPP